MRLARRVSSVGLVLTSIDFFDELAAGLPSAGAPELRVALDAGVAVLTFVVFTTPQLLSLLVDTPLLLWAERRGRARMVALGLFGMGLSLVVAGCARTPLEFGLAFALYSPASGLACSLAQASLMDHDPGRREHGMTAWVLAGTLGDLFAPLAISAAVLGAGTFRGAWWVVGALLVALSPFVARRALPEAVPSAEGDAAGGTLRAALRNRPLLGWLAGVALCGLLDETLTTFGALLLKERFPGSPFAVTAGLFGCTVGGVLGLLLLKRLLHRLSPRVLLGVSCAGSVVLLSGWLRSTSVLASTLWLFFLGVLVAWQYPLAQARAYHAAHGRSGQVAVLGPLFSTFELASPIALGVLADRSGLTLALVALLAQPLGLLVVLRVSRSYASGMPESDRAARAASRPGFPWLLGLGLAVGLGVGWLAPGWLAGPEPPKPLPDVISQIRELSRLEGVSYHVERVVDLKDKQQKLFGLVESEDAILLVASGDVVAGVDLGALKPGDVVVAADRRSVTIKLPHAEIFSARLDNDRTFVHTRKTDLLAERKESLETEARKAAEATLRAAAEEGGILKRADESVARTVRALVRSLGFETVNVGFRDGA